MLLSPLGRLKGGDFCHPLLKAEQCRRSAFLSPICSPSGLIPARTNRHLDKEIKTGPFPSFQPSFPAFHNNVCEHTRTPHRPAGSVIPGRDHHMEGDGQSAVLRGRRSHSGLPGCWIVSKTLWQFDSSLYRGWGKKKKKDHKECHWAGGEGLEPCQTSMNTGLQQDAGTALPHLPPH